jgi:DNA gyrase inhibitor GyrI
MEMKCERVRGMHVIQRVQCICGTGKDTVYAAIKYFFSQWIQDSTYESSGILSAEVALSFIERVGPSRHV